MDNHKSLKENYIKKMTQDVPDDLDDLIDEITAFQKYPQIETFYINWSVDNNVFMSEIGLPSSAPTMIEFREPQIDNKKFITIGFNNYGDRICIVKDTGEISYINHDSSDKLEYMNNDAISLFKCICAFADMLKGSSNYPETIKRIDSKAFSEGNWWNQEYINWQSVE
jgi:hypothetical protein